MQCMKKFATAILLLAALVLVACSSTYTTKIRIAWRDETEILTYDVSVLADYSDSSPYAGVDYPAKPDAKSSGTYTTIISGVSSGGTVTYTVNTRFEYTCYYLATGFPAGYGTPDGNYVYFENLVESVAVFSGTQGTPFQTMISSIKQVSITDVTKRDGQYNTPKAFDFTLTAMYANGKTYNYQFASSTSAALDIYGIDLDGSFSASGIDNEILLYYLRAVEMTSSGASSVSSSVNVPDPYLGRMTTLAYSYVKKVKLTVPAGVTESGLELPAGYTDAPYYDCAQISLVAAGVRPGDGVQLFYALNDSYSMSVPGYPSRRQQKLIRMQQSFWQYDLKSN